MPGKLRIGYVGVGLMGLPMVERLISHGYRVRACDIVPEKTAAAAAAGASAASSPADATDADLVLLNLPTTEAVEQAVFGDAGVASALRTPQLVIDFSTTPSASPGATPTVRSCKSSIRGCSGGISRRKATRARC